MVSPEVRIKSALWLVSIKLGHSQPHRVKIAFVRCIGKVRYRDF